MSLKILILQCIKMYPNGMIGIDDELKILHLIKITIIYKIKLINIIKILLKNTCRIGRNVISSSIGGNSK